MKKYPNIVVGLGVQLLLAAGFMNGSACAQGFPGRGITIIVSTSPGGLNDLLARTVGQIVSKGVGQPVVVDYRPGAGTLIGMSACAKAAPDGYTTCITTPESLVYNPLLFSKLPYNPETDFVPVTNLVRGAGGVVVANAGAPGNTLPEMIAYAKSKPGVLNFATWGPGSIPAVVLGWINYTNAVNIASIPYKGSGPTVPALLTGEVQVTYAAYGLVSQHVKTGKLKLLAAAGASRSPFLPDTPCLGEYKSDPGLNSYFGMYAPSKTPAPVVARLSSEFARAVNDPSMKDFLIKEALIAVGNTPAEFAAFIKDDRTNAARIFKAVGVSPSDSPPNN